MRFLLTLPLLAVLALPLTGCFDRDGRKKGHGHCDDEPAPANVANLTRGVWNVVLSASTPTTAVFRPQAEPQRGSHFKYVFMANGNYTAVALDCTSHSTAAGAWALQGNTLTLYPTGAAAEVKQIVSLSATELQLAR